MASIKVILKYVPRKEKSGKQSGCGVIKGKRTEIIATVS